LYDTALLILAADALFSTHAGLYVGGGCLGHFKRGADGLVRVFAVLFVTHAAGEYTARDPVTFSVATAGGARFFEFTKSIDSGPCHGTLVVVANAGLDYPAGKYVIEAELRGTVVARAGFEVLAEK
jgi:hypothetical protein